jgi:hypothetical protein
MLKPKEGFINQNDTPNILVNVDDSALDAYKKQRDYIKNTFSKFEEINNLKQEVAEIKSDISEIKQLLIQSLSNK